MKKLVLPLGILGMVVLLSAAMAVDCLRLAADARHRVVLADGEMQKQEARLVKVLSGSSKNSPEVQAAIAAHQGAKDPQSRHNAYEQLVANFQKNAESVDVVDPTNPLDRKFMDEAVGAINRREVAQKQYDEESATYQSYLNSFRGRVARAFSSQARADLKSGS